VKNKNILLLVLSAGIMLYALSFVSSAHAVACIGCAQTFITGEVYYGTPDQPVEGADVLIKCKHNGITKRAKATTLEDGTYAAHFLQEECDEDDYVLVVAKKDGVTGSDGGEVENTELRKIDIAMVDVALVPEFGFFIGGLTVLGALGVFFVVRKK
jgi:hypothetical protein